MRGLIIVLALAFLVPLAAAQTGAQAAAANCAPPCGPIPVTVSVELEAWKGVSFDAEGNFETKGKVSYEFDIDQNGYAYDPQKTVDITMRVSKKVPWVVGEVSPKTIPVPVNARECPDCIRQAGAPDQFEFYYEAPITVNMHQEYVPSQEELDGYLRPDGTYKVGVSGTSNENLMGTPATGYAAGLLEGYGLKDVRFSPPPNASVNPPAAGKDPDGLAPGAPLAWLLAAAGAAAFAARRRRP